MENILDENTNKTRQGSSSLTIDEVNINDFEVMNFLGSGSFGKVFQVSKLHGEHKGRIFAMKIEKKTELNNHIEKEAERELQILRSVKHPFIVDLVYGWRTRAKIYLVLEYLAGGELHTLLEKERMMMEDKAIFYLCQVLLALDHLHGRGVLYRDLKPENVMLDRDGNVKLIDFGLSCVRDDDEGVGDETSSFCGTIEYMAPEVIKCEGRVGYESDWWSFGILAHDMLTGDVPFTGNNRKIISDKILRGKLKLKPFVTPNAKELIQKLLKKDPRKRLGRGPQGGGDIRAQRFFQNVDWECVLDKRTKPPFRPSLRSEDDMSRFENQDLEDMFQRFSFN